MHDSRASIVLITLKQQKSRVMPESGSLDGVDVYKNFSNQKFEGQKRNADRRFEPRNKYLTNITGLIRQVLPQLAESMRVGSQFPITALHTVARS